MAAAIPLAQVLLDLSSRFDETLSKIPFHLLFAGHIFFVCSLFKGLKPFWLRSAIVTFVAAVGGGLVTSSLTYQAQVCESSGCFTQASA